VSLPFAIIARALGALTLALAFAPSAFGTIWYVSPCGSNGWAGVSANCIGPLGPKQTIQAAIAVAADGDEIRVLPGGYVGPLDLDGKAIHLRGLLGAAATIVNGSGNSSVVLCNSGEGPDTVIEGLTITGGNAAANGGGMLIALANPTIVDCVFSNNTAGTTGGGVSVVLGSPQFIGCTFADNHATNGGGGASTSFGLPVFEGCLFEDNSAFFGGGIATSGGSPALDNCQVRFNAADQGAGLHCALGSPSIENSDFTSNLAGQSGGGIYSSNADLVITLTDFIDNSAVDFGGGLVVFDGNVAAFDSTFMFNDADFGGGVYATGGALVSIVSCAVSDNVASGSEGGIGAVDSDLTLLGCIIVGNTAVTIGGLGVTGGTLSAIGCTVSNNTGQFACGGAGLGFIDAKDAVFQLCTFTGNIGAIGGGAMLLLEAGATVETTQFLGNFAATGGGIGNLSETTPSELRLRDCHFSGNQCNVDGGAVRVDSWVELEAVRCTFLSNESLFGAAGAIYSLETPTRLVSCEFLGNVADTVGGAVYATGELSCVNCVFAQNTSDGNGGALYLAGLSDGELANCTLAANSAGGNGGAVYTAGFNGMSIVNSIIWNNTSPQLAGGSFTPKYSIVPAGVAGPGCFTSNPKFVSPLGGNYRLLLSSPALDVGLTWLVPSDAADADDDGNLIEAVDVDLDGNPRVTTADDSGCAV
jgi:predicted outer membrane repeat protein